MYLWRGKGKFMGTKRKSKLKADTYLKKFWNNNERFADLFNTFLFQGEQQIKPMQLKEMDTDLSSVISMDGYLETLAKTRDVIKKSDGQNDYIVYAIESQMEVHYGMPLRTMLYDALTYFKEIAILQKNNKQEKGLTKAEFLSGLKKEERIHPVFTIILYYGEKEWNGPKNLKDMMIPMAPELESVFANYQMNLLQVVNSEQYCFQNEQVQDTFEFSRKIFRGEFAEIEKSERKVSQEVGILVGLITGYHELVDYSVERKDGFDMCKAVENFKQLEHQKGREDGIKVGIKETIKKFYESGVSAEKIAEAMKMSETEVFQIIQDRK